MVENREKQISTSKYLQRFNPTHLHHIHYIKPPPRTDAEQAKSVK
jgi:hypothetical protein